MLENSIKDWKNKFDKELEKWLNILKKVCKVLDKILSRDKTKEYLETYEESITIGILKLIN